MEAIENVVADALEAALGFVDPIAHALASRAAARGDVSAIAKALEAVLPRPKPAPVRIHFVRSPFHTTQKGEL